MCKNLLRFYEMSKIIRALPEEKYDSPTKTQCVITNDKNVFLLDAIVTLIIGGMWLF